MFIKYLTALHKYLILLVVRIMSQLGSWLFQTQQSGVQLTAASVSTGGLFLYGIFSTGLQFDPLAPDTSRRVACLEFRCPIVSYLGDAIDTVVNGNLTVPGKPNGCCVDGYVYF